jgi:hypothetical protein
MAIISALTKAYRSALKNSCIPMRGGGFGSVKGIFSKNINQSNVRLEDQVVLYGIIPGALIDARAIPQPTVFHITKIYGASLSSR